MPVVDTDIKQYVTALLLISALLSLPSISTATPLKFDAKDVSSQWDKQRFTLHVEQQRIRIKDRIANSDFTDSDSIQLAPAFSWHQNARYLAIRVRVAPHHRPLWGNKLFQLNYGKTHLAPLLTKAQQSQKPFIPALTGTYYFALPQRTDTPEALSVTTAAGRNIDFTIESIRTITQAPISAKPLWRYNKLGYPTGSAQLAVIEQHQDAITTFRYSTTQTTVTEKTVKPTFNTQSGLFNYQVRLPNAERSSTLQLIDQPSIQLTTHGHYLQRYRDNAWQSFNWVMTGENSPYPNAHHQDKQARIFGTQKTADVYGGWYDAGDYGKYTVNGAYSVGLILLAQLYAKDQLRFPVQFTHSSDQQSVLSLVTTELDFLLKMQREDGAVYHKVATPQWPSVTTSPNADTAPRYILPITTTATANFAAVMYMAAAALTQTETEDTRKRAALYRQAADQAWAYLQSTPAPLTAKPRYAKQTFGGGYLDEDDTDERLWAAVARWHLTREHTLEKKLTQTLQKALNRGTLLTQHSDWKNLGFLPLYLYLHHAPDKGSITFKQLLDAALAHAETTLVQQKNSPYALPFPQTGKQFSWGSNGIIATQALIMLFNYHLTKDPRYAESATDMSHWFFGLNPHGKIFVTGSGADQVHNPMFRPYLSGAIPRPDGFLVGGPNSQSIQEDPVLRDKPHTPALMSYVDHSDSFTTNEIAINWQASWASYLSLLWEYHKPN